jgi:hypothetical protein
MHRTQALLFTLAGGLLASAMSHAACSGAPAQQQADLATIQAHVQGRARQVLTFVGYSGAGYEDEAAMLALAGRILDGQDPARVLVNIGATAEGIGAVYTLARQRGFGTMGIVSSLARDAQVPLSPCVDQVFFVPDSSWGGLQPAAGGQPAQLSPTSQAMVAVSDRLVGIGGGEVGRDELLAARQLGKPVLFHPADMHHGTAIDKARRKGEPAPTDFRGAAHAAWLPG